LPIILDGDVQYNARRQQAYSGGRIARNGFVPMKILASGYRSYSRTQNRRFVTARREYIKKEAKGAIQSARKTAESARKGNRAFKKILCHGGSCFFLHAVLE
jgi:hypothetical protein